MHQHSTSEIQGLLDQLETDKDARKKLMEWTYDRLRALAAKIKWKSFRVLGKQEWTDEIANEAVVRLYQAFKEVNPRTPLDFFRLAAQHIRWILLDVVRQTPHVADASSPAAPGSSTSTQSERFQNLYEEIAKLPEEEYEVIDLIFVLGLTQAEVAELLGVAEKTVYRRLTSAKIKLGQNLAN